MAIKSLRKRLGLLILLPVGLLLFLVGFFGFVYMRGTLFDEWQDVSIMKLQRAAHQIDMRLSRVIGWVQMFHKTAETRGGPLIQQWILQQLRDLEGVTRAELKWKDNRPEPMAMPMRMGGPATDGPRMMRFHGARSFDVTPPHYDAQTGQETVKLISGLKDESGSLVGTLEISVSFHYLLEGIKGFAWWQTDQACLIDDHGRYLAHTEAIMKGRKRFGEADDPFELSLLRAISEKPFGTVMGPGKPPDHVGGFYRLKYAPWTIVLFAPGEEVLAPIIRFRNYYFAGGALAVLLILLMIRSVVGRMVRSFTVISDAAGEVAKGNYGPPIPENSKDEIGQLTRSFNTMVKGLKERDFVTNTFGRYVDPEIAEKLMKLPEASRLGGERREVAILMSDIRGFTPLSERLNPDAVISFLNRYFSRLIDVIQKHQGIIVDFFGDGVLVFFDPLDGPAGPVIHKCVACALEMQNAIAGFNAEMRKNQLPEFATGIGVNAGEVVVGNIGSETRAKYGIVGSPVNVSHRIQSTAKRGEVVISESVYRQVSEYVHIRRSFVMSLKGVKGEVNLYVVDEIKSPPSPDLL